MDFMFCILCGTTLKLSEGQEQEMHWGDGDGWKHKNISDCLIGLRSEVEGLRTYIREQ